jgi:membrane protease YdiL (CAAX protease family)
VTTSDQAVEPTHRAGEPSGESVRKILFEILALWLVVNLLIRGVRIAYDSMSGLGWWVELGLAIVPVLFMYTPVLVCRLRGVDSWSYPLAVPSLRDWPTWRKAIGVNLVVIGIVAVPFFVLYHFWHLYVFGHTFKGIYTERILLIVGYHLFFVAIPEELFYRGYLQTRLNEAFSTRWRVLGATIGPGLLIATLLFAFGHSIVVFQWWHFAIMLPGLVFAWMRARTGDIMAGAFFHAWCNITVTVLDIMYGIQPP